MAFQVSLFAYSLVEFSLRANHTSRQEATHLKKTGKDANTTLKALLNAFNITFCMIPDFMESNLGKRVNRIAL